MAVNWGLLNVPDIGGNMLAAIEQGKERRRQQEQQNALAAYATNPTEAGIAGLAQVNPMLAIQERGRFAEQRNAEKEQQRSALEQRLKMVAQVAAMADTPEKWDVGVDYLVGQGYTDLAEYKGRFSPELRASAVAAGGDVDKFLERMQPKVLGPGSQLVDPTDGRTIASAPFAPRSITLSPGQTAYSFNPNDGGGDLYSRILQIEGGTDRNGNFLTSPAGAIGPAQLMPGTAPEAMRLAGFDPNDQSWRNNPEVNMAAGKAYFDKQVADFGDPVLAAAAYNAGPGRVRAALQRGGPEGWTNFLPRETQDYVRKFAGMASGTPIASAPPAPEKRPDAPSGFRFKADGSLEPIPGGPADKPRQAKPIPVSQENKLSEQFDIFSALNRAVTNFNPDFAGNTMTGGLENTLQGVFGTGTPGQRDWWADFRQTDNLIRNQMFGSALTDTEKRAYEATTISERMAPAQVQKNLQRRRDIVQKALQRRARFLVTQGYNPESVSALFGDEPSIVGNLTAPAGSSQSAAPARSANRDARLRYNPATGRLENAN